MEDFGSDFITITDEDGVEYELEILSELDYQGAHYLAVVRLYRHTVLESGKNPGD